MEVYINVKKLYIFQKLCRLMCKNKKYIFVNKCKGYPHYNSEKVTLPGIPQNFGRSSGMQNDDLSRYFQLKIAKKSSFLHF